MSNLREAAELALEALEANLCKWDEKTKAITALRAALAEPEQEPFGYLWPTGMHPEFRFTQQKRNGVEGVPLYTAPTPRKPLTDEEIIKLIHPIVMADLSDEMTDFEIARAIEKAHGIGEQT